MKPDLDLLAGLVSAAYAITAAILEATGVVDLGPVIAPAHTAGSFAAVALGRWYNRKRKA